jgi:hypothetical protein
MPAPKHVCEHNTGLPGTADWRVAGKPCYLTVYLAFDKRLRSELKAVDSRPPDENRLKVLSIFDVQTEAAIFATTPSPVKNRKNTGGRVLQAAKSFHVSGSAGG